PPQSPLKARHPTSTAAPIPQASHAETVLSSTSPLRPDTPSFTRDMAGHPPITVASRRSPAPSQPNAHTPPHGIRDANPKPVKLKSQVYYRTVTTSRFEDLLPELPPRLT